LIEISGGGGSDYTNEEDTILTLGLYRYGYGFWELIRNDLRNDSRLSFNLLAKSRTASDI
jgi:hypothetical protein